MVQRNHVMLVSEAWDIPAEFELGRVPNYITGRFSLGIIPKHLTISSLP